MSERGVWRVAIVGAGAAGLTAAIAAAERIRREGTRRRTTPEVAVLDGAARLGAKILVSGGGRCNVTNVTVVPEDFNGSRQQIRKVLAAFSARDAALWFRSMGVDLREEAGGKLFPATGRARDVLGALLGRCRALGIEVRTRCRVHAINRVAAAQEGEGGATDPPSLRVVHEAGETLAARVVLATGGSSLPRSGSDGEGFRIAAAGGHSVIGPAPALVPLVLAEGMLHGSLSGVSLPAEMLTRRDRRIIDRRTGDLLWTHFGVSGPVVLDASRHWTTARAAGARVEITVSFLPGEDFESVQRMLLRESSEGGARSCRRALAGRIPERLAEALMLRAGIDRSRRIGDLRRDERRNLARALVELPLPIERDRGWSHAETTAGGVPLSEIDPRTMGSRKVPGLHLAGEILDCDGRVGGFNFQWAWSTGWIAGRGAAGATGRGARGKGGRGAGGPGHD